MVDREQLKRDMQSTREDLARRAEALATDHEAIMADTRATLKRAQEAEPLHYKTTYTPVVTKAAVGWPDVIPDTWIDAVSTALAYSREELRGECQALVERAQTPLRENIARLEGQLATLMTMFGENPKSKRHKS